MFSTRLDNFLPFSSNLKLSSAKTLSVWKSLKSVVWERVNPFPNKPWFLHVCIISLLKTLWEKEKLLVTSNFYFSHSVFYPFGELSAIFIKFKIIVCKTLWVWKSLKLVVWERVNSERLRAQRNLGQVPIFHGNKRFTLCNQMMHMFLLKISSVVRTLRRATSKRISCWRWRKCCLSAFHTLSEADPII